DPTPKQRRRVYPAGCWATDRRRRLCRRCAVVDAGVVACSNVGMDPVDLARSFGLGGAPRLSDGPLARGKQGLVWQLETTEGRWAVKVPLRAWSEDEVRASTAFHEAAHA